LSLAVRPRECPAFPFDFGFIPSTIGDDGDPLDVLVLMDEPVFPGCRIRCRLVGVIEAEQSDGKETERNDRLLAIAEDCLNHKDVRSIKDLNDHVLEEIEHFFVSYHELGGKQFKPLARHGPNRAIKLVRKGVKQSEALGRGGDEEAPQTNGRARTRASK
jgi:inorganic pyrophosphatase